MEQLSQCSEINEALTPELEAAKQYLIPEQPKLDQDTPIEEQITTIAEYIAGISHGQYAWEVRKEGGTIPRTTEDLGWVQAAGGDVNIDLAQLNFKDLPVDWYVKNIRSAKLVVGSILPIMEKIGADDLFPPEEVVRIATELHADYVAVNPDRIKTSPDDTHTTDGRIKFDADFNNLPQEEKDKDIRFILNAIEACNQVRGTTVSIPHAG